MSENNTNILIITLSDVGRHVGCYGVETVNTENIDKIAEDGVRFENCFATAPQCSPSRASLMTGRYPQSNGVMGLAHSPFEWNLDRDVKHICQILSENGYYTYILGLQHSTHDESLLGCDKRTKISDVKEEYSDVDLSKSEKIAKKAGEFLENYSKDEPFYLNINFEKAHRIRDGFDIEDKSKIKNQENINPPDYLPNKKPVREEIAEMEGSIQETDEAFGQIWEKLEETENLENTLIILTTDHGIPFPRAKGTLYDPGVEIFLVLYWPDEIEGGEVYEELVSNVDILPTILEAIGIEIPDYVEGKSLLPLLKDREYTERKYVFTQKTFHEYYDPIRAIRSRRHKLIQKFEKTPPYEIPTDVQRGKVYNEISKDYLEKPDKKIELYQLIEGPTEKNNIAEQNNVTKIKKKLSKELYQWMQKTNDPLLEGPISSPHYRKSLEILLDSE